MKLIKILGLAMVAGLASMALLGASNASAKAPHICKINATPCAVGDQYGYPLAFTATLVSPEQELKGNAVPAQKCQGSTLSGTFTEKNEAKQQIIGKLETLKQTNCHLVGVIACLDTELQLPYTVHLAQTATQGNGTLSIGPQVQGGGQPGLRMVCPGAGVDCTFKANEKQVTEIDAFEKELRWINFGVVGGVPPVMTGNQVSMKPEPATAGCPNGASWFGEYKLTSPSGAWISHQA